MPPAPGLAAPPPRSVPGGNALRLLDGFLLLRDGEPLSLPTGGQRLVALLGSAARTTGR